MQPNQTQYAAYVPEFLVELPSQPRVFFGNLAALFLPQGLSRLKLCSAPAPFWPDVFVKRGLPWIAFLQSGACHFLAFMLLVVLSRFLALLPQPAPQRPFDHSQVIYYSAAEYLPPLDTRVTQASRPAKADPEFSRQPIISVPPEADNRSQTIIAPPKVKLKRDVPLPNIVAWSEKMEKPRLAIPAAPLTPAADITRIAPRMKDSVVSPPPDLRASRTTTAFEAPAPAVVAPPPVVDNTPARALGELNIGHSSVIAPAPQLQVEEQQAVPSGRLSTTTVPQVAPQVVPPPPSFSAGGSTSDSYGSPGRMIALNLHPAVGAPPDPPPGNRRGSFAATPEGHPGASGAPGSSSGVAGANGSGGSSENGSSPSRKATDGIPAGLYVGKAPASAKTSSVAADPPAASTAFRAADPNLTASLTPPSAAPASHVQPGSVTNLFAAERVVFGPRRFYSLTLNMPNLNSAGGSWVIHFAELSSDANNRDSDNRDSGNQRSGGSASNSTAGSLSPPSVIRKVDPAYPLQLMRENVGGTVILYAVIHANGTVGNVRVLRGVDDRLDRFACQAVAQWLFQPATKNGVPVDVEATFVIPFRPARLSGF
jgi:TonB family protein